MRGPTEFVVLILVVARDNGPAVGLGGPGFRSPGRAWSVGRARAYWSGSLGEEHDAGQGGGDIGCTGPADLCFQLPPADAVGDPGGGVQDAVAQRLRLSPSQAAIQRQQLSQTSGVAASAGPYHPAECPARPVLESVLDSAGHRRCSRTNRCPGLGAAAAGPLCSRSSPVAIGSPGLAKNTPSRSSGAICAPRAASGPGSEGQRNATTLGRPAITPIGSSAAGFGVVAGWQMHQPDAPADAIDEGAGRGLVHPARGDHLPSRRSSA